MLQRSGLVPPSDEVVALVRQLNKYYKGPGEQGLDIYEREMGAEK